MAGELWIVSEENGGIKDFSLFIGLSFGTVVFVSVSTEEQKEHQDKDES